MGAVADYAALIDAVDSQRERLQGPPGPDIWGGETAKRFRADPKRQMDDNYETLAALVKPDDVFVDAGGGAGRCGLPVALRCRAAINVDLPAGMGEAVEDGAAGAGRAYARRMGGGGLQFGGQARMQGEGEWFVKYGTEVRFGYRAHPNPANNEASSEISTPLLGNAEPGGE